MSETANISVIILLTGLIIIFAILSKQALTHAGVPSLVGFILLGFLLNAGGTGWSFLSQDIRKILGVFANIGVIALLFRTGLESKLTGLLKQLRQANIIWVGDVLFGAMPGFATAHYVLGASVITSVFVGAAMSATSVGVSLAIWKEAGVMQTRNGELIIDVSEMDDITAIVLVALLYSVVPVFEGRTGQNLFSALAATTVEYFFELAVLGAGCVLFGLYAEKPHFEFYRRLKPEPVPMLLVVGTGFIIAALTGFIGISVAIGAFFAGLVFSRDPRSVKIDEALSALYELFVPFFFIGIGLAVTPATFADAAGFGFVMLIAAIIGKVLGAGIVAFPGMGIGVRY
ncbi:MAG: cation:proton antiporter [Nitrospirota bacterium]|nr:cation:proton antiporter [Nitrospirota bacterium]